MHFTAFALYAVCGGVPLFISLLVGGMTAAPTASMYFVLLGYLILTFLASLVTFFMSRVASALAILGGNVSLLLPVSLIYESQFLGAPMFGVLSAIAVTVAARHLFLSQAELWRSSRSIVPVAEGLTTGVISLGVLLAWLVAMVLVGKIFGW